MSQPSGAGASTMADTLLSSLGTARYPFTSSPHRSEATMRQRSRRELLLGAGRVGLASAGLALLAGCETVGGGRLLPAQTAERGRLETTTIRLVQIPTICQAPQYLITDLMRAEGFTQVEYVKKGGTKDIETALAAGEADINMHFA